MQYGYHLVPFATSLILLSLYLSGSLSAAKSARNAVYVTASFTDRNHLFIEDLSRDEVEILENGEVRKIEFMAKGEIPVSYGIVFERGLLPRHEETERSRYGRGTGATSAKDICYELIDKNLGRQSIWVGVYDRSLEIVQDATTDAFQAKRAIQSLRGAQRAPESHLFAALVSAVMKMNTRPENRRVLLLFLEILDVETAGKIKALRNLLSASNVELFVVSFASKLGSRRGALLPQMSQSALKDLVQSTSGEAFFTADYGEHLEDVSRRMLNHVRTFYTFGFESASSAGKPATLSIRCSRQNSKVKHHPTVSASE